jgi:hypothetical protein
MHAENKEEKLNAQLVVVTGFLILYFLFKKSLFLYTSLILVLIFLFIPLLGGYIINLCFKLCELLALINTRIPLSIVYFVFLIPISLLFRMFIANPLSLTNINSSHYITRDHLYTAKDLENPWQV